MSWAGPAPESYSIIYDSGDYPALLRQALEDIDYESLRPIIGREVDGKYHGVGTACFVKSTGTGDPGEGARIAVTNAGGPFQGPLPGERGMEQYPGQGAETPPQAEVAVYLGISTMGQGHETIFAQICADGLGVPLENITVYHGSTDLTPYGGGTYASRGTTLAGNAVYGAAQKLRERVVAVAAGYLDVDPSELSLTDGLVHRADYPQGAGITITLAEVLRLTAPASRYNLGEAGLEATHYFQSPQELYPCGAHAVHVAVDPETGEIDILRYVIAEDVGHVINPLLLRGQITGAAAQGVGATILEELVYDEQGQMLAGTFMDYLLPTATDIPDFEIKVLDLAPSPLNPLGVKGGGEIGIVATGRRAVQRRVKRTGTAGCTGSGPAAESGPHPPAW